jgi:hypothetical protein
MFSRGQLATLWWEGALVTDMRQRNPGPAGTLKYKPTTFIVPTLEGLRSRSDSTLHSACLARRSCAMTAISAGPYPRIPVLLSACRRDIVVSRGGCCGSSHPERVKRRVTASDGDEFE